MNEMKIAIIGVRSMGYTAGIDCYVTEVATRLANRRHDVTVFCQSPYTKKTDRYHGVRLVIIRTVKNKYLNTPIYAILATLQVMMHKYDIIQYHGLGSAFCSLVPRLLGKKTVVTVHALDWEGKKWGFFSKMILMFIGWVIPRFSSRTTVVSKVVQGFFKKKYHRHVEYIPNGANILPLKEPQLIRKYGLDKENYILCLGRLTPGKGCEYLIQAFNQLMETDLKLVISGDTMYDHNYVKLLMKFSDPSTIFTGWVQGDIKEELFSNAYLFVQPSELEGMSGVLLEAMSYGRCAIVSDIPQNLEAIGKAGCSFKNGDIDDLRRVMESLIHKRDRMAKMGNLARQRIIEHYHWDKITDTWEKLYNSL